MRNPPLAYVCSNYSIYAIIMLYSIAMTVIELLIIAVGLSMDAFAVAICKGLAVKTARLSQMLIIGLYFGGFQALMPTIGYFAGVHFQSVISAYDHWAAFALLAIIGGNMIRESRNTGAQCPADAAAADADGASAGTGAASASFSVRVMLPLAVATSIDALAAGISFALLHVSIQTAACCIGAITFVISAAGLKIGAVFGNTYQSRAECAGGIILIIMGIKIVLQHTGILSF